MADRTDAELARLDPSDLAEQLISRLSALPPDAYLRCFAYFMALCQRLYHQDGLPEAYHRIVDSIVALTAQAAAGARVQDAAELLDREWTELTYPDLEDDADLQPYEGPLNPSSIERGEVWLLVTDAGDVAATVSLSTGDPGPGLWDERDRNDAATYLSRLAVRPDFQGQEIGAQLLDWARVHAYLHGSRFLRIAAWPRTPRLHAYLRQQGFHPLWTVAGPPATSRTLFIRRAAPNDTVVRITEA